MNLITAVGLKTWILRCKSEKVRFSTWPLAQKSLFWAKGHCQFNFSFWLLGGKRNHETQPCGVRVNSCRLARGAAPLPRLCVPAAPARPGRGSGTWKTAQISNLTWFLFDQSVCFLKIEISLSLFTWWCPFSIIKMFMFSENREKWFSFQGRGELICHYNLHKKYQKYLEGFHRRWYFLSVKVNLD